MFVLAKVYLNTSILIRAINPRHPRHKKSLEFLKECCRKHICIISNVHGREKWRLETIKKIRALLKTLNVRKGEVNIPQLEEEAVKYIKKRGLSPKNVMDVMHLLAARSLGCKYIAAVDRFIRSHAKHFNLTYINYYTGRPS